MATEWCTTIKKIVKVGKAIRKMVHNKDCEVFDYESPEYCCNPKTVTVEDAIIRVIAHQTCWITNPEEREREWEEWAEQLFFPERRFLFISQLHFIDCLAVELEYVALSKRLLKFFALCDYLHKLIEKCNIYNFASEETKIRELFYSNCELRRQEKLNVANQ